MFIQLKKEWQVVIPAALIDELGLQEDSTMECFIVEGEVRLRPASAIEKKRDK